jgi:DNA-binding CsgD family transcriptional regulator
VKAARRSRETADSRLLELLASIYGLIELEEFRRGIVDALRTSLRADWVSLNEFGETGTPIATIVAPPVAAEVHEGFGRLGHQNPLVQRSMRTRDGRVYRLSDLVSQEELHALPLYRDVYAPIGLEHQIAFTLPHEPPRMLGIALSRKRHDFDDWERDVLERARPFLIQGYRNAVHYERARMVSGTGNGNGNGNGHAPKDALRARGLTPREAEVVGLIAAGRSNRDAAAELGLSARTVQKHLEHAYRKLGVRTRSEAAAMTWELADGRVPVP